MISNDPFPYLREGEAILRSTRFRPVCETVELPAFPQELCDQELPAKGQE